MKGRWWETQNEQHHLSYLSLVNLVVLVFGKANMWFKAYQRLSQGNFISPFLVPLSVGCFQIDYLDVLSSAKGTVKEVMRHILGEVNNE